MSQSNTTSARPAPKEILSIAEKYYRQAYPIIESFSKNDFDKA